MKHKQELVSWAQVTKTRQCHIHSEWSSYTSSYAPSRLLRISLLQMKRRNFRYLGRTWTWRLVSASCLSTRFKLTSRLSSMTMLKIVSLFISNSIFFNSLKSLNPRESKITYCILVIKGVHLQTVLHSLPNCGMCMSVLNCVSNTCFRFAISLFLLNKQR